ncbi:type II toxin-antitoxin system PemK/MazF family toxin [Sulfitobacter aestuarii]|uniref:Type II toxin-antitoxin system PemK/MazF family toxin n=1 Tax=Sulfitobacter aestuarii TaxID=2161676 RepID=A0ABW5TXQ2_9RHOB
MSKALPFHPRAGQVLVADFRAFEVPEITKVRPVVVISPKLRFRAGLVTIVPVSTTAPRHSEPYCYRLSRN